MDKLKNWWQGHKPCKRRLIQLYAALLYNANLSGFGTGRIFTGVTKSVCVPGLNCYSCPGAAFACPLGSLQNALAASGVGAFRYIIGILLLFGLTLGRTICGWLCPVGLIQELLYKIKSPKVRKSKVTRALSYTKYFILIVFVVIIPVVYGLQKIAVPAFCKYICPAGTLEGAIPLLIHPANSELRDAAGGLFLWKLVLLILILVATVFIYRVFCRFLCPLGALYGLFAKFALVGIRVDETKCTGCGACIKACKMDCKSVGDHECINCGECRKVCAAEAIGYSVGGKGGRAKLILQISAVAVLAGMLVFTGISSKSQPAADNGTAVDEQVEHGTSKAPDFTITAIDGRTFDSSNIDKVIVINFWATWCGPCVAELPDLEKFAHDYSDKVCVLAVHTGSITEDVNAWIASSGLDMNFAIDDTYEIESLFGELWAIPHTIVIDKQKNIVYSAPGKLEYETLLNICEQCW